VEGILEGRTNLKDFSDMEEGERGNRGMGKRRKAGKEYGGNRRKEMPAIKMSRATSEQGLGKKVFETTALRTMAGRVQKGIL